MKGIPMDRILVPTDFSEHSRKAFRYAVELARVFHAEIVLLHVLDTRIVDNVYHIHQLPPEQARDKMLRSAEAAAQALLDGEEREGIAVSVRTSEGIPPVEVKRVAGEVGADLIVMGTHGTTGLTQLLYGSTAQGVVQEAPCPVLTVNP